jgi:ATP-binding cassette subfamily B protein
VTELLNHQAAVIESQEPQRLSSEKLKTLQLVNLGFAYKNSTQPTLKNINLSVPAGSKIGIYGESGAGKSSLLNLLQRHYDPDEGQIWLDGLEYKTLSLDSLRNSVATVDQDSLLMSGTVIDNIRYSNPQASQNEVEQAAKLASIHDTILSLPEQYNTDIGQRGTRLSGGQRQRLCIARALIQAPSLLLLDEATSALDQHQAQDIISSIDHLFSHTTRIIISHQRELLVQVDELYELSHGQLHRRSA